MYIEDSEKLKRVFRILYKHQDLTDNFYLSHLRCQVQGSRQNKIVSMFIVANRQRRTNEAGLETAENMFEEKYDRIISLLNDTPSEEKKEELLGTLCEINGVQQKTANLFLKWVIMFSDKFNLGIKNSEEWLPLLDVPLDRWVIRLLGHGFLDIGTEEFNNHFFNNSHQPKPPGYSRGGKYNRLQSEIKAVAESVNIPAIILDGLWMVGNLFCNYKSCLCDYCWLREECTAD